MVTEKFDVISMFCPWARNCALKCFTLLRFELIHGRTEIGICMISSQHQNGCKAVCNREFKWHMNEQVL